MTLKILNDQHYKKFIEYKGIKESTQEVYSYILENYCDILGKTLTELIEEAEEEEDQRIRMKKRHLKDHLIKYRDHMESRNLSYKTMKSNMATVRSVYREFEIELPRIRLKPNEDETLITTDDIIKKEDIIKALKHCNLKYKAIIILMMSSGMGSSELRHLTFKNFLDSIELTDFTPSDINTLRAEIESRRNPIATWRIKRFKTGMPYITFSSHESIFAILDYLENRKYPIKNDNDWLFETFGEQIKRKTLIDNFIGINDDAKLGKLGRQRFFRAHALRRFFASTLESRKVPQLFTDWMLGHTVKPITGAYFKPNVSALRNEYLRVLPHLCINDVEVKTIESIEFQELKEQHFKDSKAKDEEIQKLKAEKDEEMAEMKRELNVVKDLLLNSGVRKELDKRDNSSKQ